MHRQRTATKGFTLIELLIVVVIIGILAAIAIPKFANTKEKAYLATMKTDLRNLLTAQELYSSSNGGVYYTTSASVTSPDSIAPLHYSPSVGVTVVLASSGASGGYNAKATMSGKTTKSCDIFVGPAAVVVSSGSATSEGVPACLP